MNSYERVMAVLEGRQADRIPNVNILMQYAAREIGVKYKDYALDYQNLAEGNIVCAQKYGLDCVTVMKDPCTEGYDLGAQVEFPEDDVPYFSAPLIEDENDLAKLSPVEVREGGRMHCCVQAVELYRKKVGGKYAIIGWVEGCFAEAADLMGVTPFLMALADPDEEGLVRGVLDLCMEQALIYARAQVDAGADIIGVGDAIASVAGPKAYSKFAREYEEKLLSSIKAMGVKTKLHICGNIQPMLGQIPVEYCDIVDVDWMVPLDEAVEAFEGKTAVTGNYDPVSVLMSGSAATIDAAVRGCAATCGARYLTAAGCEVPRATPEANLMQVKLTVDSLCGA